MKVTRRDFIAVAAAAPILGAAKVPPMPPIVPIPGTRLYPTWWWDPAQPGPWWTTQPVSGWTYPTQAQPFIYSFGAGIIPGIGRVDRWNSVLGRFECVDETTLTSIADIRNTPQEGAFTRAYLQLCTPPLSGPQTLTGVVSAAIHCVEGNSRVNAVLALQVVVHRPDGGVRGIALPVSQDTLEFPVDYPAKSRAAQNWPLAAVECLDGDVIAINVGVAANNQTHQLGYIVGFNVYEDLLANDKPLDISRLDDPQLANTWVQFSSTLTFKNPSGCGFAAKCECPTIEPSAGPVGTKFKITVTDPSKKMHDGDVCYFYDFGEDPVNGTPAFVDHIYPDPTPDHPDTTILEGTVPTLSVPSGQQKQPYSVTVGKAGPDGTFLPDFIGLTFDVTR